MNTDNIKTFISECFNNNQPVQDVSSFINQEDRLQNIPAQYAVLLDVNLTMEEIIYCINSDNINHINDGGESLFISCCRKRPEIAQYLYDKYDNLDIFSNSQYEKTLSAICCRDNKYSRYLVDNIIEKMTQEQINQQCEHIFQTPLMVAAKGNFYCFQKLIEKGANIYIKDVDGKDVEDICEEYFNKFSRSPIIGRQARKEASNILSLIRSIKQKDRSIKEKDSIKNQLNQKTKNKINKQNSIPIIKKRHLIL